jgi:hypothetical protein
MTPFETDDGLIVTQEGTAVRAQRGRLNYVFRDRSTDTVAKEYRESVARVRSRFGPRRSRLSAGEMTDEEFADLTQEIALHWMRFYIVNGMRVDVTGADMDHPQSKHIIWSFFCRKCGDQSPDVSRLASALSGMSQRAFEQWLEGWKRYLDK